MHVGVHVGVHVLLVDGLTSARVGEYVGVHVARGMLDYNRLPLELASMLVSMLACARWRACGSWNA